MSQINWKQITLSAIASMIISTLAVSALILYIPAFQNALRGPQGDQGPIGETGPQGVIGPQGESFVFSGMNWLIEDRWFFDSKDPQTYTPSSTGLFVEFYIDTDIAFLLWKYYPVIQGEESNYLVRIASYDGTSYPGSGAVRDFTGWSPEEAVSTWSESSGTFVFGKGRHSVLLRGHNVEILLELYLYRP